MLRLVVREGMIPAAPRHRRRGRWRRLFASAEPRAAGVRRERVRSADAHGRGGHPGASSRFWPVSSPPIARRASIPPPSSATDAASPPESWPADPRAIIPRDRDVPPRRDPPARRHRDRLPPDGGGRGAPPGRGPPEAHRLRAREHEPARHAAAELARIPRPRAHDREAGGRAARGLARGLVRLGGQRRVRGRVPAEAGALSHAPPPRDLAGREPGPSRDEHGGRGRPAADGRDGLRARRVPPRLRPQRQRGRAGGGGAAGRGLGWKRRGGSPASSTVPRSTGWCRTRLRATAENRRRIAGYKSMYADDAPGWIAARKALKQMGALCRERGVPLVVVIFPLFGNPLDDGYPFPEIHAKVGPGGRGSGGQGAGPAARVSRPALGHPRRGRGRRRAPQRDRAPHRGQQDPARAGRRGALDPRRAAPGRDRAAAPSAHEHDHGHAAASPSPSPSP